MQYIMLVIAAMLLGADFAVNKVYQKAYGSSIGSSLTFNMLSGIFTAIFFFVIGGFKAEFTVFSALMAAMSALFVASYKLIGFKILNSSGKISIYTTYLMTGGMTLPYIWGILFMNEPFKIARMIGLFIMILGIALPNIMSGRINGGKKVLTMCFAVFALNGGVSIISKIHQTEAVYECVSTSGFVVLSGIFTAVFAAVALYFTHSEVKISLSVEKKMAIIATSAAIGGASHMLQLIGAANLPATVLYPLVTGGSIIFSALADLIFFREKLSLSQILSVIICFSGTLFFL